MPDLRAAIGIGGRQRQLPQGRQVGGIIADDIDAPRAGVGGVGEILDECAGRETVSREDGVESRAAQAGGEGDPILAVDLVYVTRQRQVARRLTVDDEQIGCGSCRDSVCRYVSVWVAADA